jgi:hypothetical protein
MATSELTTIDATDTISASRSTINDNFSTLNARTWQLKDQLYIADDFMGGILANGTPFVSGTSGSGAAVATNTVAGTAAHPGICELSSGTTSAGAAAIITRATDSILLGGGEATWEAVCRVPTLSDGTETYTVRTGLIDNGTTEATDGVFFRYTHSVNSGKWQGVCRSNGTETTVDTGSTVVAGTWVRLTAVVNAAGTSVQFYVNGVAAGAAVTTNIPTGTGRETGAGSHIIKSAGSTARTFQVDYQSLRIVLTTAR